MSEPRKAHCLWDFWCLKCDGDFTAPCDEDHPVCPHCGFRWNAYWDDCGDGPFRVLENPNATESRSPGAVAHGE